uniref:hypothetical protein n=1 Tax=Clostridioides difficile TaxID=1496 RepID=UPI002FD2B025
YHVLIKITKIIEKSFIDLNLNPFYIYSGAGHDAERAEFTLDVRSCSQEILDNSVEKIFNEISHIM